MTRRVLGRDLSALLAEMGVDLSGVAPVRGRAICEAPGCHRPNALWLVKPRGQPSRWVCGVCREIDGRKDPARFRHGYDPVNAPLVVPE